MEVLDLPVGRSGRGQRAAARRSAAGDDGRAHRGPSRPHASRSPARRVSTIRRDRGRHPPPARPTSCSFPARVRTGGACSTRADTGSSPDRSTSTLPEDRHLHLRGARLRRRARGLTFDVRPVLEAPHASRPQRARSSMRTAGSVERRGRRQPRDRAAGRDHRHPRGGGRPALVDREGGAPTQGAATQLRYVLFNGATDRRVRPAAGAGDLRPPARRAAQPRWPPYDPFRPILPESFNTVGGDLPILFDSGGNRLPQPDVRRAPQIAAADGGNTTFFVADSAAETTTACRTSSGRAPPRPTPPASPRSCCRRAAGRAS